ncbi:MAG: radical SAM protein [Candidatus Cloacimonetes bacterium]|nr:radical SAM protein [Candidatus Cloacimonadota bacterium]
MLKINEIFLSIQGESLATGLPCIFVRLTGCNIRCTYCDTTYAYEEGTEMSFDAIIEKIESYQPINLIEFTGGEPLMQLDVFLLMEKLHMKGYTMLLETNGTLSLKHLPGYVTVIMDVKTPSAQAEIPVNSDNFHRLIADKDQLKFVISDEIDYKWACEFLIANKLNHHHILFSPNTSSLQPALLAEWILRDRLPYRLHLQTHKYIWNPEARGV